MRISDHQHPIDTGVSSKPEATEVVSGLDLSGKRPS